MANTIRIKRRAAGGATGAPSPMINAELAFNEQDYTLYYGYGISVGTTASQAIAIGGSGAFLTLNTDQQVSGIKDFDSGKLKISGGTSGEITFAVPAAAGTNTITFPATTGTVITSGDTGTVTNTMLAGSITNAKLVNSTISGIALGSNLNSLTLGSYLTGSSYNGSSAVTVTVDADTANTASKIVARDASGNFSAGTITATLNGDATRATSATSATTATNIAGGANGSIPYQTGSGATSLLAAGTSGYVLKCNGAAAPSWTAATISGVSLGSNLNTLTIGTGLSGTSYNGSSAITIAIDSTVTTLTGTQTLTNKTLTFPVIDNIKIGFTTTATAAGTTTLTSASTKQQRFTGTTTQTVVMPVTSTLALGVNYLIENSSTGNITVNSSGGNTIGTVIPGTTVELTCTNIGVTDASGWDMDYTGFASITGSGANVLATSPTLVTPILGTPQSGNLVNCTFPTLNQSTTGNAASATILATARNINGVSFNGSANIDLEDRLGTAIASATTITIGTAGLGEIIHITGTTAITSLGVASRAGTRRMLIFDGALTLTHNATSLICPGAENIVTVAGTMVEVIAETTSNWRVVNITNPLVSMAELGYLNGVTSAIQTQLNSKEPTITTLTVAKGGTGVTTSTGSGSVVLSTSPTLTTPVLGTPASGNLSNCTFPTLNQSTTGNAATATTLATARNFSASGDATATAVSFNGSANVDLALTLANSGVTAGTYTKVTVDAKGRATSGATASISDLSTPTADVAWNSKKITGLADPVNAQDAATKNYVDLAVQGLDPKASVKAASTTNIASLSGTMTVDGIALVAGDRVLLKDQSTASQNGIYVVSASAWSRATDADTWSELPGAYVFVEQGAINADNGFLCTVDAGGTIGTTSITFVQFNGAGQVVAGAGLTKSGNQLDVVGTSARIVVNADSIDIDSAYVGQTSITTLGTVTTGTWNASTIGVAKGGTGATTLTGYVKGSGTSALTASATIPNTDITGLGTMSTQSASSVSITGGSITGLSTFDNITIDCGTF